MRDNGIMCMAEKWSSPIFLELSNRPGRAEECSNRR